MAKQGFVTVTGCDILSVTLRDTCHESLETDNRSWDMRPVTLSSRHSLTRLKKTQLDSARLNLRTLLNIFTER